MILPFKTVDVLLLALDVITKKSVLTNIHVALDSKYVSLLFNNKQ